VFRAWTVGVPDFCSGLFTVWIFNCIARMPECRRASFLGWTCVALLNFCNVHGHRISLVLPLSLPVGSAHLQC
jgi:hypothetical protein